MAFSTVAGDGVFLDVRLMNPGRLARAVRFLGSKFPSRRIGGSKLEIRSLQKFLLVRAAVILYSAVIPSPSLARTASPPAAVFRLSAKPGGTTRPFCFLITPIRSEPARPGWMRQALRAS